AAYRWFRHWSSCRRRHSRRAPRWGNHWCPQRLGTRQGSERKSQRSSLLSSLLIGPGTATYGENRRGRLREKLAAAEAKAPLQSLSLDFFHARRDAPLRTLRRLNLSSLCMRQKHIN